MEDQLKEALGKIPSSVGPVTLGFDVRRGYNGNITTEFRGYSRRTATICHSTLGEVVAEIQNATPLTSVMREIKESEEKLAELWQVAEKLKAQTT